jgi:hypothetical protein
MILLPSVWVCHAAPFNQYLGTLPIIPGGTDNFRE